MQVNHLQLMSDAYQKFLAEHRARIEALPWHQKKWRKITRWFRIWRGRLMYAWEVLRGEHD
jgi:hypothetical protein